MFFASDIQVSSLGQRGNLANHSTSSVFIQAGVHLTETEGLWMILAWPYGIL